MSQHAGAVERDLSGVSSCRTCRVSSSTLEAAPVLLETTDAGTALGYVSYCGTFEVRDNQVIHHTEFDIRPNLDGSVEARSVVLEGNQLILGTPRGQQPEWQRVHSPEPA